MLVAIHPDDYTNPKVGKCDASSPKWFDLLKKAGHQVKWVDVMQPDILDQLENCQGFMWRHIHIPKHRQTARRLLPVIENELGLTVYPDQKTCWHYDDKIAQYYLFKALNIPMPETMVFFDDYVAADDFLKKAKYPLVLKLWTGASSENVRLLKGYTESKQVLDCLFIKGIGHLSNALVPSFVRRIKDSIKILVKGDYPFCPWELHKNYIYVQEFLPDNNYDTRINIIGHRAFGFRRFNRKNDFRASGSGNIDYDTSKIDMKTVQMAFDVAKKLGTQSLAFDFLKKGSGYVIGEISYTYVSWAVYECTGHWELEHKDIVWKEGHMWPEEAQIEDYLQRLEPPQINVFKAVSYSAA